MILSSFGTPPKCLWHDGGDSVGRGRAAPYTKAGGRKSAGAGTLLSITGLRRECTWQELKAEFNDAGVVARSDVGGDGTGSITFESFADAVRAHSFSCAHALSLSPSLPPSLSLVFSLVCFKSGGL